MPDETTLSWAVHSIEEFAAAKAEGTGAVTIDGQLVDKATLKNYANTVDTAVTIHETSEQQAANAYHEDLLERALATDTDTPNLNQCATDSGPDSHRPIRT